MNGAGERELARTMHRRAPEIRERLKVVCTAADPLVSDTAYDLPTGFEEETAPQEMTVPADDELPLPFWTPEKGAGSALHQKLRALTGDGAKASPHIWTPDEDKRLWQMFRKNQDLAPLAEAFGCDQLEVANRIGHLRWFAERQYEQE